MKKERKEFKECKKTMASNKIVVPQAREAMDRFKMEAASQVGVTLKNGYNGELTAKQAGSCLLYTSCRVNNISCWMRPRSMKVRQAICAIL